MNQGPQCLLSTVYSRRIDSKQTESLLRIVDRVHGQNAEDFAPGFEIELWVPGMKGMLAERALIQ